MAKMRRTGSHYTLHRSKTNPRETKRIPIDIICLVIDWLSIMGTQYDMKACSLVCHDWTSHSQMHLHREIMMTLKETPMDTRRYCSSHVSRHVRHLIVEAIGPEDDTDSEEYGANDDANEAVNLRRDFGKEEDQHEPGASSQYQAVRTILLRLTDLEHLTLIFSTPHAVPREWAKLAAPLTLARMDMKGIRFKTLSLFQFLDAFPALTYIELADVIWTPTMHDGVQSLKDRRITILRNLKALSLAPASDQDDMDNSLALFLNTKPADFHKDFTLKLALPFVSTLVNLRNLLSTVGSALKHVRLGHNFSTSTSTDGFTATCEIGIRHNIALESLTFHTSDRTNPDWIPTVLSQVSSGARPGKIKIKCFLNYGVIHRNTDTNMKECVNWDLFDKTLGQSVYNQLRQVQIIVLYPRNTHSETRNRPTILTRLQRWLPRLKARNILFSKQCEWSPETSYA
ncbi:hypothetical protein QCA50_000727 [Cerrena zonata]|uniref:F-box domain-containing protein n=1 Tax=Cerrena zonata TaxID=2478898 RepID=A0AAW0H0F0_9APHY